jgi:hypothetical protein
VGVGSTYYKAPVAHSRADAPADDDIGIAAPSFNEEATASSVTNKESMHQYI